MTFFKRLAEDKDNLVDIEIPISAEEISKRNIDYNTLPPDNFNKRHRVLLTTSRYLPVSFLYQGTRHSIQYNHCTNPFCACFGQDQRELKKNDTKGRKHYRYRFSGSAKLDEKTIMCNEGHLSACSTLPISNWGVIQEIQRLVTINTVVDSEIKYAFHHNTCEHKATTVFKNPERFIKYGISKTNSQVYQCKICKKYTSILPKREQAFSYHQQRNEIVPILASLFVNRVPVKRSCEILKIGSQTYYNKMEYVYLRCLEFLERHETKPLKTRQFKQLWLNSDTFQYYLNNTRYKLFKNSESGEDKQKKLQTRILVSGDIFTGYVFRSDVAYDWHITSEFLEADTILYKCDHMEKLERKNARLDLSYCPQPPTDYDKKDGKEHFHLKADYERERKHFDSHFNYLTGLHVGINYTSVAHFWLLHEQLNVKDWHFVSDDDGSIKNAIFRVFKKEFKDGYANYFLCKIDTSKSRAQALKEEQESKQVIDLWRTINNSKKPDYEVGKEILADQLKKENLYQVIKDDKGLEQTVRLNKMIDHPIASNDSGYKQLGILTDLSNLNPQELADLLINVNNRVTDTFMQLIRRRISLLERPLLGARADKKSYIYSNYNPKYAQYLVTILRTYYNFCLVGKKHKTTPAMRLGITDRPYDWKDILYLK